MAIFPLALKISHYLFTFLCVCLVLSTIGNFEVFVSKQSVSYWNPDVSVLHRFLWDLALICIFIIQHSFMATEWFKTKLSSWLKIDASQRLVYNIFTCFSLLFLILQWHSIPETYLWYIDTQSRSLLWLFFLLCHVVAWLIFGFELLLMDVKELLGVSQVTAYHNHLSSPILSRALKLREIYSRMRHPGAVMVTFMLWFHPLMTLDRVLLASVFTTYMIGKNTLDDDHYTFAEEHFTKQWLVKRSESSVRYEYSQAD